MVEDGGWGVGSGGVCLYGVGLRLCVCVWGGCRLGDGVVGGVGLGPSTTSTSLHQQPSLMRRELITALDWI